MIEGGAGNGPSFLEKSRLGEVRRPGKAGLRFSSDFLRGRLGKPRTSHTVRGGRRSPRTSSGSGVRPNLRGYQMSLVRLGGEEKRGKVRKSEEKRGKVRKSEENLGKVIKSKERGFLRIP